ncbi:MAG: hypothetical protein R6V53_04505, partial [Candidatus Woesearchaeota archaeon]
METKGIFNKLIGTFLIIFGILGIVAFTALIPYLYTITPPSYDLSFVTERLDQVSVTLDHSSSTADNMGTTFNSAAKTVFSSESYVNSISRDIWTFSEKLDFSVLGWQPLLGPSRYLKDTVHSLNYITNDLDTTGESLLQNSEDMSTLSGDIKNISDQLSFMSDDLENSALLSQFNSKFYE